MQQSLQQSRLKEACFSSAWAGIDKLPPVNLSAHSRNLVWTLSSSAFIVSLVQNDARNTNHGEQSSSLMSALFPAYFLSVFLSFSYHTLTYL